MILALVAGVVVTTLLLVNRNEAVVCGIFFRELGEALIGCFVLTLGKSAQRKAVQRGVWLGALVGLGVAIGIGLGTRDVSSAFLTNWHQFAGVLSAVMPFLLLGFAAWHLLGHDMYTVDQRERGIWGRVLTAFFLVVREGVEFTFLSLNQSAVHVTLGVIIGAAIMGIVVYTLGKSLKNKKETTPVMSTMNIVLMASGFVMLLRASDAFVTDARWSSQLLLSFQLVYVAVAVVVLGYKLRSTKFGFKKFRSKKTSPVREKVSA